MKPHFVLKADFQRREQTRQQVLRLTAYHKAIESYESTGDIAEFVTLIQNGDELDDISKHAFVKILGDKVNAMHSHDGD